MKKLTVLSMIVLFMACIFTGCPNETSAHSMTFVDNADDPAREFTINENLGFKVRFLELASFFSTINPGFIDELDEDELNELFEAYGIIEISGVVKETNNTWTNPLIMGTAQNMYSNHDDITELVDFISVGIVLNYNYLDGDISAVDVAFSGSADDLVIEMASNLMGGTYTRK